MYVYNRVYVRIYIFVRVCGLCPSIRSLSLSVPSFFRDKNNAKRPPIDHGPWLPAQRLADPHVSTQAVSPTIARVRRFLVGNRGSRSVWRGCHGVAVPAPSITHTSLATGRGGRSSSSLVAFPHTPRAPSPVLSSSVNAVVSFVKTRRLVFTTGRPTAYTTTQRLACVDGVGERLRELGTSSYGR